MKEILHIYTHDLISIARAAKRNQGAGPGQKEQVGPSPNWLISVWCTCM